MPETADRHDVKVAEACDHAGHDHADHAPVSTRRPRPAWVAPVAMGLAGAAAIAYTAWQDPNADGVFPQCPTRELLGFDCPGCGGIRAVHAFSRGDIAGAFDHNVLAAVAVPVVVLLWVGWLLHSLGVKVPKMPTIPRPVLTVAAVVVLAFTIVRNLDGVALFEYLHSNA